MRVLCPRAHRPRAPSAAGWSLVNLLCVVSAAGILVMAGAPMLDSFRSAISLSAASDELATLLHRARWMALRAGAPRVVDLGASGVIEVKDASGQVLGEIRLATYGVRYHASAASVRFNAHGRVSQPVTIELSAPRSEKRWVRVDGSGRIQRS